MQPSNSERRRRTPAAGFTLPAILVVVGALLILAVAILLVVGIERSTARSFVDRGRADLAARAGLEDVKGILKLETTNDDYLVIQATDPVKNGAPKDPAPYLYLARGSSVGDKVKFRYVPLFSSSESLPSPGAGNPLKAPQPQTLVDSETAKELPALPWNDPAMVSWKTIKGADGKLVSRYAYWVEDLQGKLDGKIAGNLAGSGGLPARAKFPDPASAPVEKDAALLRSIAIHALDPAATDTPVANNSDGNNLTKLIIDGRPAMLSPDSILGATGIAAKTGGVQRDTKTGLLTDPVAAAFERDVSPVNRSYTEQPLVPYADGFSETVRGEPKINLNELLAVSRSSAVDRFASWIDKALPGANSFDDRKGDFPDDYLKTLAAGALDYADADSDPTVREGSYLGLDAHPLMSEIVLQFNFQGVQKKAAGGYSLNWKFRLFAELWNMTNKPVSGSAQLSYEVNLLPTPIGASAESLPFDDSSILDDRLQSVHNLTKIDGKYYGPPVNIVLEPDQYKFEEFATVEYTIDFVPQMRNGKPKNEFFDLSEPEVDARGLTIRWNNNPVQRIKTIDRDPYGVSGYGTVSAILQPRAQGKGAIPGHSYGKYEELRNNFGVNNYGDPRIAHYLRTRPLAENAYPDNLSPNRRNIRLKSIYELDTSGDKRVYYGRVLPSEWPDGGHDSPTGSFGYVTDNKMAPTDMHINWPTPPAPLAANAPQRISNAGRFYSAAELGNVYDPILWTPVYADIKGKGGSGLADTRILIPDRGTRVKPNVPPARNRFPDVSFGSRPSTEYGGGNTLRIGRPEHEKFDRPGQRASQLLDLFHVGIPDSPETAELRGPVVKINGHVNINTAGRDALRAMAAGLLMQDPELRRVTNWAHDTKGGINAAQTAKIKLGTPTQAKVADRIADAILLRRPFASASELASVTDKDDNPVFGNRDLYKEKDIQWSDAAAEEVFARVYDASTLRSRNFRVWVIGQAVTGTEAEPEVLSETRRVYTVFADPGKRQSDGTINPTTYHPRVTYENDF